MNIVIAAYSYIAALVGAGFASGQEILSFFVVHSKAGLLGIFFSSLIFGYFAYFILNICRIYNITDYNTLLAKAFRGRFNSIVNIITLIFTCVVYCVMCACAGEMLYLLCGIKHIYGNILLSFLCSVILAAKNNNALKINGFLGIFIVIGICACTIYILRYREHQTFYNTSRAIIAGAGYAGYNLLGCGFTLAALSSEIKTKRDAVYTGVISAIVLFIMTFLIWALLSLYYKFINLGEIPMLTMALRENKVIATIYSIILVISVLSTAISSGFGVLDMTKTHLNRRVCITLLAVIGILTSQIGFSSLINKVYRVCGYAGIVIIITLICKMQIKYKKKEDNKR